MTSRLKAFAALLTALPLTVFAVPITDPAGDLLPTFVPGDDPTLHGDTDVISSEVFYNPSTDRFTFTGTHAANIGASTLADGTPSAIYVWGLDRGEGTERLAAIVDDVLFDSVVVLAADGSGFFLDLVTLGATPQAIGGVAISGPTISADVEGSLIASLGVFAPEEYTWNLWPRFILENSLIFTDPAVSDFAPDRGNASLTIVGVVPEPAMLLSFGLGLLLVIASRKEKQHP